MVTRIGVGLFLLMFLHAAVDYAIRNFSVADIFVYSVAALFVGAPFLILLACYFFHGLGPVETEVYPSVN